MLVPRKFMNNGTPVGIAVGGVTHDVARRVAMLRLLPAIMTARGSCAALWRAVFFCEVEQSTEWERRGKDS